MRWCYVPAGCVAAKYPGRVAMCCGLAVVVTCGQPADGFIERWWEMNRQARQIDRHHVGGDRYLVPGQGGDVFGALGEDGDQDRGEGGPRGQRPRGGGSSGPAEFTRCDQRGLFDAW